MPGQNGTGPMGMGPMTGRGMGPCGGGFAYGRGRRGDRGFGWRRFWGYYPTAMPSAEEEAKILAEDANLLEEELKGIKVRLAELKSQK